MLFKKNRVFIHSLALKRFLKSRFLKINLFVVAYLLLFISLVSLYILTLSETESVKQTLGESTYSDKPNIAYLEISPTETPKPTITPTEIPIPTATPAPIQISPSPKFAQTNSSPDTTKTIENVASDHAMATANEIFNALNAYRNEKGIGSLSWDDNLGEFAQGRVNTFSSNGDLDSHAGFRNYMENGGFEDSGFNGLGENSARLAGPMGGDKIIREIYGASSAHNASQLDPAWTHAGVAINGVFVNINFGKNKR